MNRPKSKQPPRKDVRGQDVSITASEIHTSARQDRSPARLYKDVRDVIRKHPGLLLALGFVSEIVALWLGNIASNYMAGVYDCNLTPPTRNMASFFALCGVVFAIISLYIAIKQKKTGLIVSAVAVIFVCCVLSLVALFLSYFCLSF